MRILDRAQLARAIVALIALDRIGVAIAQESRDVAFAVSKICPRQNGESAGAPVQRRTRGRLIAELPHQALHERVVVVVQVLTQLAVDLETFEVPLPG